MIEAATQPRPRRRFLSFFLLLVLLGMVFLGVICARIVRAAAGDQLGSSDAIVVFGAAEYAGRPSPVFRARLDHAFDLYQRGLAPVVIISGGSAADPKFSEGGVGHDYLMRRGIPEPSLIAETQGNDTAQSAERIAVIMRANHMSRCIAVSDAYHMFRIRQLLEGEGIAVELAPRPDSLPRTRSLRTLAVLREALSYVAWKLHLSP